MTKRYYVFVLILLGLSLAAIAQVGDTIRLRDTNAFKSSYVPQPLILKTNPMAILWGPIPFTAEYRMVAEITTGRKRSAQIGISYLGKSPIWSMAENYAHTPTDYQLKVNGYRIQVSQKFYLISRRRYAPFGFYISPNVSYSNAHIAIGLQRHYSQTYFDFQHFSANLLMGVQMGRRTRITMDVFWGLGYKKNTVNYHANNYRISNYNTKDFGPVYNSPVNAVFGINWGLKRY
jgi:hypothetical protein